MTFWTATLYTSDAKTGGPGVLANILDCTITRSQLEPDDIAIVTRYTDSVANQADVTQYIEVYAGDTTPQTLMASGYIYDVAKTPDGSGAMTIRAASALRALSEFICMDGLHMNYGSGYNNVLDSLNGINQVGQAAGPGKKGNLTGSGWVVRWKDPTTAGVRTTTTSGSTALNAVTINTVGNPTSLGFVQGNAVRLGGANGDTYQITSVGTSSFTVSVGTFATYAAGTTVEDMGYQLPGVGDSWFSSLAPALDVLKEKASRYHFYGRATQTSTERSGVVEIGPLLDDSGLTIWGGKPLRDDLATNHSVNLPVANAGLAQEYGYAVIETAEYENTRVQLKNVIFPVGDGEGDSAVTLKSIFGSVVQSDGVTPVAGVTANPDNYYYTGCPKWYFLNATKASWNGNTFQLVAQQRQNGTWQYGVANVTSLNTFGPRVMGKKFNHCHTANTLLSNAIGALDYHGDQVPSWVFTVLHPRMSASRVPARVIPGQKITVNYQGHVTDSYGTDITYLSYPGSGLTTQQTKKLTRCVGVTEHFSADAGYSATYTMGSGHVDFAKWRDGVARQLEKHDHQRNKRHVFKKKDFDGMPFIISAGAVEDPQLNTLALYAGQVAVSDVPYDNYFSDHHGVSFNITLPAGALVRFWFSKAADGTVQNTSSSRIYGIYQIATSTSGAESKFFTTTDGSSLTARGSRRGNKLMDVNGRLAAGDYRVYLEWSGAQYIAHIAGADSKGIYRETKTAVWNDVGASGSKVIQQQGAFGWYIAACPTGSVVIQQVHAEASKRTKTAPNSIGIGQLGNNNPTKKRTKLTQTQSDAIKSANAGQAFPQMAWMD